MELSPQNISFSFPFYIWNLGLPETSFPIFQFTGLVVAALSPACQGGGH